MSPRDLVRRAGLLCIHFKRNLAYHRAGWLNDAPIYPRTEICATINSNFLNIAVLEWCKLFAELKGTHHWRKIIRSPDIFKQQLLMELSMSDEGWTDYIKTVTAYRNKFVAHLDELPVMQIPILAPASASVSCLYLTLLDQDTISFLIDFPKDLNEYYSRCYIAGESLYSKMAVSSDIYEKKE